MQNYGVDSQSSWKTGFGTYTAGFSWQKDTYIGNDYGSPASSVPLKERDLLALFGQIDHAFSAKTNAIVGLRLDSILQQNGLSNYNEVSPQMQLLHKINKEQSFYVNVGKSFRAPNWTAMYSSTTITVPNKSLEPDSGWTYELGWKKIGQLDSLKVALYKLDFSNLHKWVKINADTFQSQNAGFRNLGLEIEYARSLKNGWGYKVGAMFGNPESQEQGKAWEQSEAKLQINSGLTYKKGNWTGSLMATYVGSRQMDTYNTVAQTLKPSLQANLTLGYDISKNTNISLRVENLFNRIDYTNASGYITPERSFYLKLTQKF